MALELKQEARLFQTIVMTPQLQQAIKLLQLSHLDLENVIAEELKENPALEEEGPEEDSGEEKREPETTPEMTVSDRIADWQDYIDNHENARHDKLTTDTSREDDGFHPWENTSRKESLQDYLLSQLRLTKWTQEDGKVAIFIIGNLDENGYLELSLDEVCLATDATMEQAERVLKRVQQFDPVGVAARDLRECLLVQLETLGLANSLAARLVADHLSHLEYRRYDKIAVELHVSVESVLEAAHLIASLEPKPGRDFGDETPRTIVPDVLVEKVGDDYVVILNEDGVPHLRVSSLYRRLGQDKGDDVKEAKAYIDEKLRAATWLIKSIQWRQQTLYRVSESIFKFQRAFLDHGVSQLRPLVLRDVAQEIDMHESTVSRATSNKYAYTPQGVFELKYFFQSGIPRTDSESVVASESVRKEIKRLVDSEDPTRPRSDQEIASALEQLGIDIARRTVAKYREQLGILPSSRRKQPFPPYK